MKTLLAIATLFLPTCISLELQTPYGTASFDGKRTVKLSYSPK